MDEIVKQLRYTGEVRPQAGDRDPQTGLPLLPYLPSPELVEAVNLAIVLERPLLLKGEPGCGKTRLARAVAYEFGLPFEAWYVKSTSRARDGFYTYDTVGRLRDAQLAAAGQFTTPEDVTRISDPATYLQWEALGRAFLNEERTVVLVDEIDKADIDFPNDLLRELDELCFRVPELSRDFRAQSVPIVFITSNDEKELPDAFLRRCLFHYLAFPTKKRLQEIVGAIYPKTPPELAERAIARFLQLRQEMERDKGRTGKKVSTSELLDWLRVLQSYPEDEVLKKLEGKLPFAGVLLKRWEDHQRYLGEEPLPNVSPRERS